MISSIPYKKQTLMFTCIAVFVLLTLSGCGASRKVAINETVKNDMGTDEAKSVEPKDVSQSLVPESMVRKSDTEKASLADPKQKADHIRTAFAGFNQLIQEGGKPGQKESKPSPPPVKLQGKEPGYGDKAQKAALPGLPPIGAKAPVFGAKSGKPGVPGLKPEIGADGQEKIQLELAFDNADLFEVLDVTLFELFEVSYMVDPSIKAKVTFHISGSYTRNEFIVFLNNLLQLNNLSVVQGPGNIYMVVRRANSPGSGNVPLVTTDTPSDMVGDVTRLYKLRYMSSTTALNTLRPMMSKGAVTVQEPMSNTLILTDTPENIARAATIISILDVPYFKDISWRLFPLKGADVEDVAKDINVIFKTGGLYNRPGINTGSFSVIPIKSLNALLMVTRWPDLLDLAQSWISAMDHEAEMESGTNVYVYFAENASAKDLADVLKQLYGGKPSTSKKQTTSIVEQRASSSTTTQTETTPKGRQETTITGDLAGDIEIVADEVNNALVIKANKRDYRTIKSVLDQLDIVPRQVLINVVVAEIKLSDKTEFGVEWFLDGSLSGYTGQAISENYSMGSRAMGTALGASSTGFSYAIYDASEFMRGLVVALDEDSGVNILSSPSILAVDNKEALIEVVEEIPVVTGKYTDATGAKSDTIEYKKTGVILTVTPQINSSGLVKLELSQEVSKLGEKLTEDNYSILNRTATTNLVIEDGQTILIGGLMDTTESKAEAGIPYLKDIPILGGLFKRQTTEVSKTELILLITPNFINNRTQADRITKEFSDKVNRLKGLIEEKGF